MAMPSQPVVAARGTTRIVAPGHPPTPTHLPTEICALAQIFFAIARK